MGLLLAFVGLTGSILVFKPEISYFLTTRQFGQVIPQEQQLSPEKILDIAKAGYPNLQPVAIHLPKERYHPYTLQMASPDANPKVYLDGYKEVFVNPYTGAIMGDPQREQVSIACFSTCTIDCSLKTWELRSLVLLPFCCSFSASLV